jgi:hypothetical protein
MQLGRARQVAPIGGLVHFLCIALSTLTLFEFVIRRSLQEENETLSGIYPGKPKRQTARPSAERP